MGPKELRERIDDILHANNIFKMAAHGWLDADTEDPEFIGHAMWQTQSLSFYYADACFAASQGQALPPKLLEPWEKFLVVAGEDFEGLIEAARLTIGLTLLSRDTPDHAVESEVSFFQTYLMQSMMTLGAASERIRDVFIAAAFQETRNGYCNPRDEALRKRRKRYVAPFEEAREKFNTPAWGAMTRSLALLPEMASRVYEFYRMRNEIVHELATEIAKRRKQYVEAPPTEPVDYAAWEEFQDEIRAAIAQEEVAQRRRLSEDIDRPMNWYRLLMKFSNHIFIVENVCRR